MLTCELKETTKKSPLLTRSGRKPQMGTKEMKVTVSHPQITTNLEDAFNYTEKDNASASCWTRDLEDPSIQ